MRKYSQVIRVTPAYFDVAPNTIDMYYDNEIKLANIETAHHRLLRGICRWF